MIMKYLLDFVFLILINDYSLFFYPPMTKVREKKPLNEILQEAKRQGFSIDTTQYSEGWESIALMKKDN